MLAFCLVVRAALALHPATRKHEAPLAALLSHLLHLFDNKTDAHVLDCLQLCECKREANGNERDDAQDTRVRSLWSSTSLTVCTERLHVHNQNVHMFLAPTAFAVDW